MTAEGVASFAEQGRQIVPLTGVGGRELGAGGHKSRAGRGLRVDLESAAGEFDLVVLAEIRLELEPLADRHPFFADVTVAPAALPIDASISPDEFNPGRQ